LGSWVSSGAPLRGLVREPGSPHGSPGPDPLQRGTRFSRSPSDSIERSASLRSLRFSASERSPFLAPQKWTPVPQPYFRALPFPPPAILSLRVEEALAEKLRAIQQRATERDLYDAVRYGSRGFDPDLVRLLAVAKLWYDREGFDPAKLLATLAEGRREWPDLERLIGRRRRRDWNRDCAEMAQRFAFLRALTPFEQQLVSDARRHSLRKELEDRRQTYSARAAGL
jgi:hypothetical protein